MDTVKKGDKFEDEVYDFFVSEIKGERFFAIGSERKLGVSTRPRAKHATAPVY